MPVKRKVKREPIPECFATLEEAGDFWDRHSLADYWDQTKPVKNMVIKIERRHYLFELEASVFDHLQKAARKRGISCQELANQLLRERLQKKQTRKE